jgi:hypothetical protein
MSCQMYPDPLFLPQCIGAYCLCAFPLLPSSSESLRLRDFALNHYHFPFASAISTLFGDGSAVMTSVAGTK